MEYLSHSVEETKRIAAEFARTLKGGETVLLEGALGAGKTTFAQGLAEALGVTDPVRSPTFAVMNLYPAARGTIKRVVHFDFYRFKKPEEALEIGLEEFVGQPETLCIAEWPDLAGPHLAPSSAIRVRFETTDNGRRIRIER